MESLRQDLRYALRQLGRSPGFALVTVLTLALGIGANTAIFSVVNGVLLRPLPYAHGGELVHLGATGSPGGADDVRFSVQELLDYRRQSRTLAGIVEYHSMGFALLGRGEPDEVQAGVVSASFFQELGVRPLFGRVFRPEEDQIGAPPVLVLSHGYWQRRFGGDAGIVGQSLRMNERSIAVVGILPPLPGYPGADDVFMPTSACPFRTSDRALHRREARMLRLFARLRPGVQPAAAAVEVATVAERLHRAYPASYKKGAPVTVPVVPVGDDLTRQFRPTLLVLLGTVGMVLLIACANVANLALARLITRDREIVVRTALGAGRGRLLRQFLTESILLSLLGGALGLLVGFSVLRFLVAFAQRFTPRASEIAVDAPVLWFTLGVSLATGLACGALPALQAMRREIVTSLKEGSGHATLGTGGHRAQALLIVVQVAVSFVLLIGAGLTLRSVVELQRIDPGFKPGNVVTFTVTLPLAKYPHSPDFRRFFSQLMARLAAHPGVVSAAVATDGPLDGGLMNPTFKVENQATPPGAPEPQATFHAVSPDYFRTLGIPLLRGRMFTLQDHEEAAAVALISRSMAREFWPHEDPIGKRIAMTNLGQGDFRTIIGIVGDTKQHGLQAEAGSGFYYPFLQAPGLHQQVFVRTAANPESIIREVRGELQHLDPEQPISAIHTLEQARSDQISPYRLTATLLGLFAALAFLVTVAGVSGMMAFYVNQRTQEIGIRCALGAQPRAVLGLVLLEGMRLVVVGLLFGVGGALALSRLLASMLFGTGPADPLTFVGVSLALLSIVGLACLVPARRAAKLDPVIALRSL